MIGKQYGVLPYLKGKKKRRMVLITSRTHGYWIFPKGGRGSSKTSRDAALREAYEEAGLRGRLDKNERIRVTILREGRKLTLTLYPMQVEKCHDTWPEIEERERIFVSPSEAEAMIECAGMKKALRRWRKSNPRR